MIKLKVLTHNSGEYETTVEEFDAAAVNEQLNSNEVNTIVIGDLILSRIDVKVIHRLPDEMSEEEEPVEEEPAEDVPEEEIVDQ